MKKLTLSIFILGSFGFYVVWQSQNTPLSALMAPSPAIVSAQNPQVASTKKTVPTKSSPTPTTPKKGLYNDGTYTGSVADAYYGNVQVEAVITSGKISDVIFLDYPQDRNTSIRINSRAMPILTEEAITAQNANVNGVSGASDTSAAFIQSLSSALAQAKA